MKGRKERKKKPTLPSLPTFPWHLPTPAQIIQYASCPTTILHCAWPRPRARKTNIQNATWFHRWESKYARCTWRGNLGDWWTYRRWLSRRPDGLFDGMPAEWSGYCEQQNVSGQGLSEGLLIIRIKLWLHFLVSGWLAGGRASCWLASLKGPWESQLLQNSIDRWKYM